MWRTRKLHAESPLRLSDSNLVPSNSEATGLTSGPLCLQAEANLSTNAFLTCCLIMVQKHNKQSNLT